MIPTLKVTRHLYCKIVQEKYPPPMLPSITARSSFKNLYRWKRAWGMGPWPWLHGSFFGSGWYNQTGINKIGFGTTCKLTKRSQTQVLKNHLGEDVMNNLFHTFLTGKGYYGSKAAKQLENVLLSLHSSTDIFHFSSSESFPVTGIGNLPAGNNNDSNVQVLLHDFCQA